MWGPEHNTSALLLSLFTQVPRRGVFSELPLYGVLGSSRR